MKSRFIQIVQPEDDDLYLAKLTVREAQRNFANALKQVRSGVPVLIHDKKCKKDDVLIIPADWLWLLCALQCVPVKKFSRPMTPETIELIREVACLENKLCLKEPTESKLS